jgi:hypothetical protein
MVHIRRPAVSPVVETVRRLRDHGRHACRSVIDKGLRSDQTVQFCVPNIIITEDARLWTSTHATHHI